MRAASTGFWNFLMTAKARLPFFYGWIVVAVTFITMAIGVNARTTFSLFFPPILLEFGWERGVTAGAFSFGFVASSIVSPLIGRLMDRAGHRRQRRNSSADVTGGERTGIWPWLCLK